MGCGVFDLGVARFCHQNRGTWNFKSSSFQSQDFNYLFWKCLSYSSFELEYNVSAHFEFKVTLMFFELGLIFVGPIPLGSQCHNYVYFRDKYVVNNIGLYQDQ